MGWAIGFVDGGIVGENVARMYEKSIFFEIRADEICRVAQEVLLCLRR